MIHALAISFLLSIATVSAFSLKKDSMKVRLVEIFIACNLMTRNRDKILFPKVVEQIKMPYGMRYVIRLPDGVSSDVVIDKYWDTFSEALGKDISMEFDKFLKIDVYERDIPKDVPFEYEDRHDNKVAISENGKGKIYIDLEKDAPHYLVGGATQMGKSTLNRILLTTLALRENCPVLYLADLKGGIELGLFKDLKVTEAFATDLDSLLEITTQLINIMYERYDIMIKRGTTSWKGRSILFLLDEMIDLYDTKNSTVKNIKKNLMALSSKGAAAGIRLVCCTQRPDANVIDGIIKTNFHNKICLRVVDAVQSRIILGEGNSHGAMLPEIAGRCITFMNTSKDISQVYNLGYDQAKELLKDVERHEEPPPRERSALEEDSLRIG